MSAFLTIVSILTHFFYISTAEVDTLCHDKASLSFTSDNGVLNLNGDRFNMKGLSWFGFETQNYVVHGLWCQDYHTLIDFIANYSFNALRLPFSCEIVLNDPMPQTIQIDSAMNSDLANLTSMQVMDVIIKACGDAGILVMLDMHSLEAGGYMQDGLWYDDKYPQSTTLKVWNMMVDRYKDYWNVFAIDVFNEPFDATWGQGDDSTDFNTWCQTVGNDVHQDTEWLILCEGDAISPPCTDACFWGENLQGVRTNPVELNMANKIVYSPHVCLCIYIVYILAHIIYYNKVYGPSVAYQKYFNVPDFPSNMPAIWNQHWGYIKNESKSAIAVGEWGGQLSGNDGTWMNAFVNYLIAIDAKDTFFWCLNPDSGDTGGLLEYDWETPVTPKLDLLQKLQPNPTKITPQLDGSICVN